MCERPYKLMLVTADNELLDWANIYVDSDHRCPIHIFVGHSYVHQPLPNGDYRASGTGRHLFLMIPEIVHPRIFQPRTYWQQIKDALRRRYGSSKSAA